MTRKLETREDPARGITVGPREETQARQSWAVVMPFFSAIAFTALTIAKLCSKFPGLKRVKRARTSPSEVDNNR
jgi:hypothetical protein